MSEAPRFLCVTVPLFPLAARLRSEPELRTEAAVVCDGNGSGAHVLAGTRLARTAGVTPGMTLAQARTLVPRLLARGRDTEVERAASEALLDAALLFSPRVEKTGEGIVTLDVTGLTRHMRGLCVSVAPPVPGCAPAVAPPVHRASSPELAFSHAVLSAVARAGLPARAGMASRMLTARVAAAGRPKNPDVLVFGDAVYVPPGREADFLAPLPLERLAPELRLAATLSRWGLHAIGDLARLPESDVAARLGEAGAALHAKACGADPEPFLAHVPPSAFTEGFGFDWPVTELSSFMAFARAALERLIERLAVQGLGATRLDLELRLDPDGTDARTLTLPAPTREAKTLLTLLSLHLEKSPPRAPLLGFSLTAHPDRPRRGQLTLFGPPEISPDALATLLARLTALLGEGLAGTPVTTDGHRPERQGSSAYAPPSAPPRRREPRRAFGLLSVRVLRPALGLDVDEGEARQARRPSFVRPLAAEGPLRPGRVRVASGPWRLEESWWAESPTDRMDRSYWDIELENGGLYRIFQEGSSGSWYADGIYD